jgi:hypothetical protein
MSTSEVNNLEVELNEEKNESLNDFKLVVSKRKRKETITQQEMEEEEVEEEDDDEEVITTEEMKEDDIKKLKFPPVSSDKTAVNIV